MTARRGSESDKEGGREDARAGTREARGRDRARAGTKAGLARQELLARIVEALENSGLGRVRHRYSFVVCILFAICEAGPVQVRALTVPLRRTTPVFR